MRALVGMLAHGILGACIGGSARLMTSEIYRVRATNACPSCGAEKSLAAKRCRSCWYTHRPRTYRKRALTDEAVVNLHTIASTLTRQYTRAIQQDQAARFVRALSESAHHG